MPKVEPICHVLARYDQMLRVLAEQLTEQYICLVIYSEYLPNSGLNSRFAILRCASTTHQIASLAVVRQFLNKTAVGVSHPTPTSL